MWPTPQEFNEAIQSPQYCFEDSDLIRAAVSLNPLGLPRSITGAFASVYRLDTRVNSYAVRCFLESRPGLLERYRIIEDFLTGLDSPDFLPFKFLERGIKVQGNWYPVLKMEWCEGEPLDQHLHRVIKNSKRVEQLRVSFRDLVLRMEEKGIAHGDLQHGNILINEDRLYLVDYDGMFVPRLSGNESVEVGHRNFQHPRRDSSLFETGLDNFSAWLIDSSLRILAIDPGLWTSYGCGDDCLLFRHRDFRAPLKSELFADLSTHESEEVRHLGAFVSKLLRVKPDCIPNLSADEEELRLLFEDEEKQILDEVERSIKLTGEYLLENFEDYADAVEVKSRSSIRRERAQFPISPALLGRLTKMKESAHRRLVSMMVPEVWAERTVNRGVQAYNQGNYAEAIKSFKSVAETFEEKSQFYYWSYTANIHLGYSYVKTNQIGTASHYFREAQRYASVFVSHQMSLRATLLLAASYYDSGQEERSYDLIVKSLKSPSSFISVVRHEMEGAFAGSLTIANLLLRVGHIFLSKDDLENAVISFESVIEFVKGVEAESLKTQAKILVLRAITGICLSRFEKNEEQVIGMFSSNIKSSDGLRRLLDAEDRDSRLSSQARYIEFLRHVASTYYDERQYKYAKIAYKKALELAELSGWGVERSVFLADCLLGIGNTPEAAKILLNSYDGSFDQEIDLLPKLDSIYEFHYAVLVSVMVTESGGYRRRNKCLDYLASIAPTGENLKLSLRYLEDSPLNQSKNLAILLADCARDLSRSGRSSEAQEVYSVSFKIFQRAGMVDSEADRVIECLLVNDDLDTAAQLLLQSTDLEKTVRAIVGATVKNNNFQLNSICEILVKLLGIQMNLPYEHVSENELNLTLSLLKWCAEDDDLRIIIMQEKVEVWKKRREMTLAHNLIDQGKFGTAISVFEKYEGKCGVNVVQAYELWSMRYFTIALENQEHSKLALVDGYALGCAIEIISTLKERDGLNKDFALRVAALIGRSNPEGMEQHLGVLVDVFRSCGDDFFEVLEVLYECLPSLRSSVSVAEMQGLEEEDGNDGDSVFSAQPGSGSDSETDSPPIGAGNGSQSSSAVLAVRTKSRVDEKLWKALHRALFLVDRERYGEAVKAFAEFEKLDRNRRFQVDANIALGYCQYLLSNHRLAKSYFGKAVAESRGASIDGSDRLENYYRAAVSLTQFALGRELGKSKVRTIIDPSAQKKDIYRVGAGLINETIELESDLALRLADHLFEEAETHESLQHMEHALTCYEAALVIYGVNSGERLVEVVDCLDAVKQYDYAARKLRSKHIEGLISREDYQNLLLKLARRHIRTADVASVIEIYEKEEILLSGYITEVERDLFIEKLTRLLTSNIPPERFLVQLVKDLKNLDRDNKLDKEFAEKVGGFIETNIPGCEKARRERLKKGLLEVAELLEGLSSLSAFKINECFRAEKDTK